MVLNEGVKMATEAQKRFVRDLMVQAGASREEADAADFTGVSVDQASHMIETLKKTVREQRNANGGQEPPEGVHMLDGTYYKVQQARQGSGRLYAKEWTGSGWNYIGRRDAFQRLTEDTKVTQEQAAEFGRLYGICCFCSADLTDERSIAVGYGPVCGRNNGLPWGHVSEGEDAQV